MNIYCWRCGTGIEESNILGLGQFEHSIGRYQGKGFVAFSCPRCNKTRYQILDSKYHLMYSKNKNTPPDEKNELIDINKIIDFHEFLKNINTIEELLKECSPISESIEDMVKPILQPVDVYNVFHKLNKPNLRRLMVLTLDKDNYIISWDFLGEGLNAPISYEPRVIFQTAFLLKEKTSIIIAQNILKNFSEPTQNDLLVIKRLIKAGKILGINLLDHIVIGNGSYYSYDQLNYI